MESPDQQIIEAALDLFSEDGVPTVEAICARTGIDEATFFERFDDVDDVLCRSYAQAMSEAADLVVVLPDYDSLPLRERLASLCFMLFDVLERRLDFVAATYGDYASGIFTPFQTELRNQLNRLLSAPDVPGVNLVVVDTAATRCIVGASFTQLVRLWLADVSADKARSTALVDRVVALWAELLTTEVPERTAELLRYTVEAGYLPLDKLPFVGDWFRPESAETS